MTASIDRCRIVLILPSRLVARQSAGLLQEVLAAGDVASVMLPIPPEPAEFQNAAEILVPIVQTSGAAAIIVNDTRVAGRVGADGLHIFGEQMSAFAELSAKFSPGMIVGAGDVRTRHNALQIGETNPDYVSFGRIGGDIRPEAHDKVLALAEWWSALVEIPCIAMAGSSVESALEVAGTGADFCALSEAIFAEPARAAFHLEKANTILDESAPRF